MPSKLQIFNAEGVPNNPGKEILFIIEGIPNNRILADILNTFYESGLVRTEKQEEGSRVLFPDSLICIVKLKGTCILYQLSL